MTMHTPSRSCYVRGCRSEGCAAANRAYHAARRVARRSAGLRYPSAEKAYHAAYARARRLRKKEVVD